MTDCPCCSERAYDNCCGPIVEGQQSAPTAEALMRARYTAYAKQKIGFIRDSMLKSTQDQFDEAATTKWSAKSTWLGLEINSVEGDDDTSSEATVDFTARYERGGETEDHHEVAQFKRDKGQWYFVNGKLIGTATFVRLEPKVGRNDPCPCGSTKKYKKCCGKLS